MAQRPMQGPAGRRCVVKRTGYGAAGGNGECP
jgi:hypothetical protein